MRVLILSYEFPPLGGGAGNATAELVRALEAWPDVEVVVVTSSVDAFCVERHSFTRNSTLYRLDIGKPGGNVHYQTNAELFRFIRACRAFLARLLREESFDLCHPVMTVPAGVNAWLVRRRMPYLVSLQGSDVPGFSERFRTLYKILTPIILRVWKDAEFVVSNSEGLRRLALESAPGQAISVIPNGIDTKLFHPSDARGSSGRLHAICVGRLIERKGVFELLEAMPTVLQKIPNAHLDLVGSGALEQQLRQRTRALGISEHVTLHGSVPHDEVPALLARSDVFVLPSYAEGMSNALMEGMACGLPVIVTDTGGTAELVEDNGLIVPAKDSAALARAMIGILGDDARRSAMAEASLRITSGYSWEAMAREYLSYYEKIAARR